MLGVQDGERLVMLLLANHDCCGCAPIRTIVELVPAPPAALDLGLLVECGAVVVW